MQLKSIDTLISKPQIIIIGYHNGLLDRANCTRKWTSVFKKSIQSSVFISNEICRPCISINSNKSDSLIIVQRCLKDFNELLPFKYSQISEIINNVYNQIYDKLHSQEYEDASQLLWTNIISLCQQLDIRLIVFNISNNNLELPTEVINSGFAFWGDENYTCSPYDPFHPNEKAHRRYADTLLHYLGDL